MAALGHSELLRLIENEIDIGFTFLETHMLSFSMGHAAHADQALGNAKVSYKTAIKFLDRLTEEEARAFRPRLEKLKAAIHSATER